jgi:thiol-disulfide isomerase/thioredoxin
MINRTRIHAILICLLFIVIGIKAETSPFINTSFEQALTQAQKEGKPLFVKFYASWCAPCKWMEETTLQDEGIKNLLTNDYVSIKVNVDDFDGFTIKSKYEVRYLPTMIVFKNGRILERIEESLGINQLTKILDRNKTPIDLNVQKKPVNISPREISRPATEQSALEKESELRSLDHIYRVQVGVYSKYEGAVKIMNELSLKTFEQVQIVEDIKGNQKIYKVVIGHFINTDGAERLRSSFKKDYNIESIVVKA